MSGVSEYLKAITIRVGLSYEINIRCNYVVFDLKRKVMTVLNTYLSENQLQNRENSRN